ncbi:MAG: hypothetical protein IJT21_04675 [Synergistaceae bacterium]|nr:hypothetical protein [Synergistaceae bacterium]
MGKLFTDSTGKEILQELKTRNQQISSVQGNPNSLRTTDKSSLVAAINEVDTHADGNTTRLTTAEGKISAFEGVNAGTKLNSYYDKLLGVSYDNYPNADARDWHKISIIPWLKSHFRGKYLGTTITTAQYNAMTGVKGADMRDVQIGDFWLLPMKQHLTDKTGNVLVRVVDRCRNYFANGITDGTGNRDNGNNEGSIYNAVLTIEQVGTYDGLLNYQMNDSNTTEGGYIGSKIYQEHIPAIIDFIKSSANWGSSEWLGHAPIRACNAVTNGEESGWIQDNSEVHLISLNEMLPGGYYYRGKMPSTWFDATFPFYTMCHGAFKNFAIAGVLTRDVASGNSYWGYGSPGNYWGGWPSGVTKISAYSTSQNYYLPMFWCVIRNT